MKTGKKALRDVFIENIHKQMGKDEKIVFLAADFGSPKLDALRADYRDRFINVGIAEQNLVNVAAGFALEGYTVYCYAIAAFLTMRSYEQVRNNLSLLSQNKEMNVNLLGVGPGLSYDVSGPSHHCMEDIIIMRNLPNLMVFSPADPVTAERLAEYSTKVRKPKYIRLDGKPLGEIYQSPADVDMEKGYQECIKGEKLCLLATGYMTHLAIEAARILGKEIGVVDVFRLKPVPDPSLVEVLKSYGQVITVEESYIGKGGLDSLIREMIKKTSINMESIGFEDEYVFEVGGRNYLHKLKGMDAPAIAEKARALLKGRN